MNGRWVAVVTWVFSVGAVVCRAEELPAIRVNKNFEGASIGKIEVTGPSVFRCHVEGQYDERGHNRQASWYYFRLDGVKGRELVVTLTDLVGEYNDKPGAVPAGPGIVPVYSLDGKAWRFFPEAAFSWDGEKKEVTLRFVGEGESVWIAHVPPYTASDLKRLLEEVNRASCARVEVIGRSALGREISMVTVTDADVADAGKKVVWLQARQHAWEAGTSYVMEGALRFVTSDDPVAVEMRKKVVFKFTPMVGVDGCALGWVRFNANGFDVNRHWPAVDLRSKEMLEQMPEIWYTKKAIVSAGRIDLMVNMHNTESNEYLETFSDDEGVQKRMRRFEELLGEKSSFDASKKLVIGKEASDTTNSLWRTHRVPVMLMEQRIGVGKKLGRRATVEDRIKFGREILECMVGAVSE